MARNSIVLLCAGMLGGIACSHAAYSVNKALVEHSPFIPPGKKVKSVKRPEAVPEASAVLDSEISFHGVIHSEGEYVLSMHYAKTDEQKWCSVGDEVFGYTLTSYQPEIHQVTLSQGTQKYTLYLDGVSEISRTEKLLNGTAPINHNNQDRLIKYSSLSQKEQRAFFNPESIPILESRSIEVPDALREIADRRRSGLASKEGLGNAALSPSVPKAEQSTAKKHYVPKRYPTPRINTSHTSEERAAMARAAQGNR